MAKDSIRDYSASSSDNSDIQSVDISEGCAPSGLNNAIREVMTDLKNVSTGAVALETPVADSFSTDTISEKTSATGVTIDGVLLKDGAIGSIASAVAAHLTSINGGQIGGSRNLIINGNMAVAQRGTSETGITSQGYHTVDRFRTAYSNLADELIVTEEQDTDAPAGFGNSFKLTVTTPETSLAGDERLRLVQRVEGQNLERLKYGTSSAEYVTLSFYVKSNVTGTYGVQLDNRDDTRNVSGSYTINSANTWERKTVSFSGDTTGSFDNDNARSLDVCWYLAAGTDFTSGTFATSWESTTDANIAPSGQENLMSTANNFWAVTGIQLEVGEVATPFEHESYAATLQKCYRYFHFVGGDTTYQTIATLTNFTGGQAVGLYQHPVEMRAAPTISKSGNWAVLGGNTSVGQTVSADQNGPKTLQIGFSGGSGGTSGYSTTLRVSNDINFRLTFSAEL